MFRQGSRSTARALIVVVKLELDRFHETNAQHEIKASAVISFADRCGGSFLAPLRVLTCMDPACQVLVHI